MGLAVSSGTCGAFSGCRLGFFPLGMAQCFQVGAHGGVCVLKSVFLAPLDNGGRAHSLHDPMINCAAWASVQQYVGDVVANRESRVGRLRSLLNAHQVQSPYKKRDVAQGGELLMIKIH